MATGKRRKNPGLPGRPLSLAAIPLPAPWRWRETPEAVLLCQGDDICAVFTSLGALAALVAAFDDHAEAVREKDARVATVLRELARAL